MANKDQKEKVMKDFGIHDKDTGSVQVQVALLTDQIKRLADHFKKFPKDFASKRGLLKMVARRRKSLEYVERINVNEYKSLIERLGLRK